MIKSIKSILVLFMFLFASPTLGRANNTPSQVVERFCQFDSEGFRLSTEGYSKFKGLVSYPEEPGWDTAIAIGKYKILNEKIEKNFAEVEVFYEIMGSWPGEIENIQKYKKGKFRLKKNNNWKISEYLAYPRVGAETLCRKHQYCIEK